MDKKTTGMIRYIKRYGGEYPRYMDAAIAYMMDYSGCPKEVYTPEVIHGIVFEIFRDFIDAVDRPSYILFLMNEAMKIHVGHLHEEYTVYDAMLSAMAMIDVKNDKGEYINGFKPEDFKDCGGIRVE